MGVSYSLVRLFALVHGHPDRLGRWVYTLLNGGVLGLAGGFALAWSPLEVIGGGLLIAAVWLFAWDYRQMLRQRKRRLLDVTQHHGIAAVSYLAVVIPVGV